MSKHRILTQQQFDNLLAWLDPDREQAGVRYERIRQTLVKVCGWQGCGDAEEMADEVIDRVTRKVPDLMASYTGDPALYFYGVAKKLVLEHRRRNLGQSSVQDTRNLVATVEIHEDDPRYQCLDKCVENLTPQHRDLVLKYYQEEKQAKIDFRREIAQKMGLEVKNLRVRMFRIRIFLHKCIQDCLAGQTSMQ